MERFVLALVAAGCALPEPTDTIDVPLAATRAGLDLPGEAPFRILDSPGVDVEVAGRTLTVMADVPDRYTEYRVLVEAGDRVYEARGALMNAGWMVRHFALQTHPLWGPGSLEALIEGDPAVDAPAEEINYDWGWNTGPPGMGGDYFATCAIAIVDLPEGRYEFRTWSDDGVQVRVGDAVVIRNWTDHGPVEDVGVLDHAGGPAEIEVLHWEWGGYATLKLSFRRL